MFDAAEEAAGGQQGSDRLPQALPWLCLETPPLEATAGGGAPHLAGSLLLASHGLVASVATPPPPPPRGRDAAAASATAEQLPPPPPLVCTSLSPGEWIDATCSPRAFPPIAGWDAGGPEGRGASGGGSTVVGVTLPQMLSECCASALAGAGAPPPPPEALAPLAAGASATAVLLRLSPSHLAAFVSTLPAGPKRLQQWYSSRGAVGGGGVGGGGGLGAAVASVGGLVT